MLLLLVAVGALVITARLTHPLVAAVAVAAALLMSIITQLIRDAPTPWSLGPGELLQAVMRKQVIPILRPHVL